MGATARLVGLRIAARLVNFKVFRKFENPTRFSRESVKVGKLTNLLNLWNPNQMPPIQRRNPSQWMTLPKL